MRRLYKRFEKLRASYDLTQIVTTIPEFLKEMYFEKVSQICETGFFYIRSICGYLNWPFDTVKKFRDWAGF